MPGKELPPPTKSELFYASSSTPTVLEPSKHKASNDTEINRNQPFPSMGPDQLTPNSTTSGPNRSQKEKDRLYLNADKFLARFQPSICLENSGSVARDHLASERTFLAYVRTSLLLATTGVALVQLFAVASSDASLSSTLPQIRRLARPIGATLVVFGLVILAVGVRRYFLIQNALTKGLFPIARLGIVGITLIITVIIIVVFGILISTKN